MKTFKKILIGVICWTAVVGFCIYEASSIIKKEYARQTEIAREAHEKINFNLDMIKIAVMTEDVETYEKNLVGIKEQMGVISPLGLIENEQAEYLGLLGEYTEILENKVKLLEEMQKAKTSITAVKEKLSENYGNKDTLSREKLKEAKDKVLEYKKIIGDYSEEKIMAIVSKVDEILNGISDKASALVDCIDTCYKNRINEIDDELAEIFKGFADTVDGLNANLEKEFAFDKMKVIKESDKDEA